MIKRTLRETIALHHVKDGECWNWTGTVDGGGYHQKLSRKNVDMIRASSLKNVELARMLGVHESNISRARRGLSLA